MDTIKLPDGYNDHVVECECEPIEKDGETYKLRVKGSYLIKWCSRQQWEAAMWEAYTNEIESGIAREYEAEAYQQMEREAKYRSWLEEESGLTPRALDGLTPSRHSESCECVSCYERYCSARAARQ